MKKVLFVGHFNDQTKQIQKELSKFVSIQLCSDNVTIAESMMGIYEPDLVLVMSRDLRTVIWNFSRS